ncbi:MAG TPA: hypothetical protein VHG69_01265 [Thermoleophilaceae bacterium]|nr:hypothetical protein [Thermoleophilaceae bacterium]
MRGILEHEQATLVAPASPEVDVLGKAEGVDQVEKASPLPHQAPELLRVRLETLGDVVEGAPQPSPGQRLDLCAAVVRGDQRLGSGLDVERLHAVL